MDTSLNSTDTRTAAKHLKNKNMYIDHITTLARKIKYVNKVDILHIYLFIYLFGKYTFTVCNCKFLINYLTVE